MPEVTAALIRKMKRAIERHNLLEPGGTVVVGVSGGADSLCLLHALTALRDEYGIALHVAHLNHCLRGADSDEDARFVEQTAHDWGLPVTVSSVDVGELVRERRLSVEEAARQARYAFLARVAVEIGADRVAVAHNADDQAETVLMHFLRGAGLSGLRGMLPKSKLHELRLEGHPEARQPLLLIRPLLEVGRTEIEAYCAEQGLTPRFDLSNLDTTYFRNRLRHELIPYLETYNPNVRATLGRTGEALAAEHALLYGRADDIWEAVVKGEAREWIALDLNRWRALPLAFQRSTLRHAVEKLRSHLRDIGWEHIENAVWIARERETGTQATLPADLVLSVGYDELRISGTSPTSVDEPEFPWMRGPATPIRVPGTTPLPGSSWIAAANVLDATEEVLAEASQNADPDTAYLDADRVGSLEFRARVPGDRFCPLGMGGKRKTLREFMIGEKIAERWRGLIPLAVNGSDIVWIAGWRLDDRAKVGPGTRRILQIVMSNGSYS